MNNELFPAMDLDVSRNFFGFVLFEFFFFFFSVNEWQPKCPFGNKYLFTHDMMATVSNPRYVRDIWTTGAGSESSVEEEREGVAT